MSYLSKLNQKKYCHKCDAEYLVADGCYCALDRFELAMERLDKIAMITKRKVSAKKNHYKNATA